MTLADLTTDLTAAVVAAFTRPAGKLCASPPQLAADARNDDGVRAARAALVAALSAATHGERRAWALAHDLHPETGWVRLWSGGSAEFSAAHAADAALEAACAATEFGRACAANAAAADGAYRAERAAGVYV